MFRVITTATIFVSFIPFFFLSIYLYPLHFIGYCTCSRLLYTSWNPRNFWAIPSMYQEWPWFKLWRFRGWNTRTWQVSSRPIFYSSSRRAAMACFGSTIEDGNRKDRCVLNENDLNQVAWDRHGPLRDCTICRTFAAGALKAIKSTPAEDQKCIRTEITKGKSPRRLSWVEL